MFPLHFDLILTSIATEIFLAEIRSDRLPLLGKSQAAETDKQPPPESPHLTVLAESK